MSNSRQSVCPVKERQKTAIGNGDFRSRPGEVIAHPQGEAGGQFFVFQAVLQTPQGHAPGVCAHTEQGKDALGGGGETERPVFYHSNDVVLADKIPLRPPVSQKLQGLEIGHGVVQARPVQTAVEKKPVTAPAQTFPNRKHCVGVVLLHREDPAVLRHIAKGVEISQDDPRLDPQRLGVDHSAVGGDHQIIGRYFFNQAVKAGGAENHTGLHKSPQRIFHYHSI